MNPVPGEYNSRAHEVSLSLKHFGSKTETVKVTTGEKPEKASEAWQLALEVASEFTGKKPEHLDKYEFVPLKVQDGAKIKTVYVNVKNLAKQLHCSESSIQNASNQNELEAWVLIAKPYADMKRHFKAALDKGFLSMTGHLDPDQLREICELIERNGAAIVKDLSASGEPYSLILGTRKGLCAAVFADGKTYIVQQDQLQKKGIFIGKKGELISKKGLGAIEGLVAYRYDTGKIEQIKMPETLAITGYKLMLPRIVEAHKRDLKSSLEKMVEQAAINDNNLKYLAPEVCDYLSGKTRDVPGETALDVPKKVPVEMPRKTLDVWSAGCVLCESLGIELPWSKVKSVGDPKKDAVALYDAIGRGLPAVHKELAAKGVEGAIVAEMLNSNPDKRITAEAALQRFNSIN